MTKTQKSRAYLSIKAVQKLLNDGYEITCYVAPNWVAEISITRKTEDSFGGSSFMSDQCPQPRLKATLLNVILAKTRDINTKGPVKS